MHVRIITKDNGLGLTHDTEVLRSALVGISGHAMRVDVIDWQAKPSIERADVNIFLELLNAAHFRSAKRNIMVPNPEWFMHNWRASLGSIDQVWAKTHDCEAVFRKHHRDVVYTGWTSHDRKDVTLAKEKRLLHVAGGSSAKGTAEVIEAMGLLGHKYPLTLVSRTSYPNLHESIEQTGPLIAADLRALMNRCAVHLCPSSYEGFGHYINEARSVGAFIVTTNAQPMNELVTPDFGIGAGVGRVSYQNMAVHRHVDPASLARCIGLAMDCPLEVLTGLGSKAREAYETEGAAFEQRILNLLQ